MSSNLTPAFPFDNVKDERLYRLHRLYAESYVTNLRNLEAPWKPVIASILEAIVKKVCKEQEPSINLAVQQEQPLAPPALAAASVNADSTLTSSNHKGTVYPDVSVLRYLLDVNDKFWTLTHNDMNHKQIDYLICAELKRSIKRSTIRQGLDSRQKAYSALLKSLRSASIQATRQAFVAMKRPDEANSDMILIAAAGPFWMWCLASRNRVLGGFTGRSVEDVLDEAQEAREDDVADEQLCVDEVDNESRSFPLISSVLLTPMTKRVVFLGHYTDLPWSDVVMLDTKESELALRTLMETLVTVIRKR